MAKHFHVATKAELELLQIALDQAEGVRDNLGRPTPKRQRVFRNSVDVTGDPLYDKGVCWDMPGRNTPIIEGTDGTCAMVIPDDISVIADVLGKKLHGVAVPRLRDLVKVARAKDYDKLPTGVAAVLDDAEARDVAEDPDVTEAAVDTPAVLPDEKRVRLKDLVNELGVPRVKKILQRAVARREKAAMEKAAGLR